MRRAQAREIATDLPSGVIEVVEAPAPEPRDGWTVVKVKAVALNQHDLWSIKGVGVTADQFPLGVGSDVAGVTADGREVVVHSLVADPSRGGGTELLDPRRRMLAEASSGGAADEILVPERNLIDKPAELTFEEAACLPTAWLTAYQMLFVKAEAKPGDTVLVQGAGGGVSTAAITLASRAGLRVWVTGRDEQRLAAATELGASAVFAAGERLPARADIVLETVGAATWDHSTKSVRPGGTIVVAGATTGAKVSLDLMKIFLNHVRIVGSSMGTVEQLSSLVAFCVAADIHPAIDSVHALDDAQAAVARLESGQAVGKVVIRP
ncbi:zinc-binding dehydrogenase [Aeromicrobium sp. S22]|uniref:zinc-binding dehydrogenase n=1 Tax=Aeromicrobium sp. S22 TaxID=2662029 RepID=UPI00129D6696|nr:zinc-binding dehydrogenase [Aeromicrobium sp. S22]MRK02822.1 zinc-binding dehydrogenase [Aeromicrobium sp. S22]